MSCRSAQLVALAALFTGSGAAVADDCPVTIGANKVFAAPWPQADTWYGTEALAVILPEDGIWSTTRPGHSISVKLFWYSAGFRPHMERHFTGRVERLDAGPNDAVISRATNAYAESLGGWTILTGIDFPSIGCWRITGDYLGQSLSFVVETIEHDEYLDRFRSAQGAD